MIGPKLSININKYALVRNSRGHNTPNLLDVIDAVLAAGAHGITVHPRRDQRHIRYDDLAPITAWMREWHPGVELNIECENHPEVLAYVYELRPDQCTLVPVRPGEVTSDHGYSFPADHDELVATIDRLHDLGVRTSIFMDTTAGAMAAAAATGTDRVELYTGPYAWAWGKPEQDGEQRAMFAAAQAAVDVGMLVNAGHDLDRFNLVGLRGLPGLQEVSIGHAHACRALEVGGAQSIRELLAGLSS